LLECAAYTQQTVISCNLLQICQFTSDMFRPHRAIIRLTKDGFN